MPLDPVDIGSAPNDGQGDPLRVSFDKLNKNDEYLEGLAGAWQPAVDAEAQARAAGDQAVTEAVPGIANQEIDGRLATDTTPDTSTDTLVTPAELIARAARAYISPGLPDTYDRGIGERALEYKSVLDWCPSLVERLLILAGTSTIDATAWLQKAFLSGENLFFPRGRYNIADELVMSRQQQSIVGQNKSDTRFVIQADANLSANSFIKATHYGTLRGFTFSFMQNAATVSGLRSDLVQYPWAIDISNATHFNMSEIYVERAWRGVNGNGNCGGLTARDIKMCAFDTGVLIDGPLHHVNVFGWDHWCYGATSGPLKTIYDDGIAYAGKFGRADFFNVHVFESFKAKVQFFQGATGGPAGQFVGFAIDGDNATVEFDATGATLDIIGGYATKTNVPTVPQWVHKNGICRVTGFRMTTSGAGGNVRMEGGTLHLTAVDLLQASNTAVMIEQTGGTLSMVDNDWRFNPAARTQPIFRRSGGTTIISALRPSQKGAGSGNLIEISNDNSRDQIDISDTGGWGVVLPTGVITGSYKLGAMETFVGGVGFVTPGSSVISITQNSCNIKRESGDLYDLDWLTIFNITDITGASGSFRFGPLPITPARTAPVLISQMGQVGFNAAHFISAELSTDGYIYFRTQATAAGTGTMSTTEFPVRNSYTIRFGCKFRPRAA